MSEIQTFKIEETFSTIDDLYDYIMENVDFVGEYVGIRIEKPMIERPFCITGVEEDTQKKILFYAVQETSPESFGELIVLASAFKVDTVIFLVSKINVTLLEPMNWLNGICNDKSKFILGEVGYKKHLRLL